MKICWDNLESMRLTVHGNLIIGTNIYVERSECKVCGDPYLTPKTRIGLFCSNVCAGKAKIFSTVHRKKLSAAQTGKILSSETKKKLSKISSKRIGVLNSNYKSGVTKLGFVTYDNCKDTLGFCEDIRNQRATEILEVRCTYCGQWYAPTRHSVQNRLDAINSLNQGEQRLYCSENCKQACPTFGQHRYPKGFKKATSREVSTYLRQMVFERDNWECQKCGKTIKETALHCHHIKGYAQNKILANDIDNCITLCKDCHKEVHKQHGCGYVDLQCK